MPVPDELLELRAQELGLVGEAEELSAAAIREMLLPLYELAVLTGYTKRHLNQLCRAELIGFEVQMHPRGHREAYYSTVAQIEHYREEIGTAQDWGRKGAERRWGKQET